MGTIANAKVTHYYNCYNGDFIGCLRLVDILKRIPTEKDINQLLPGNWKVLPANNR